MKAIEVIIKAIEFALGVPGEGLIGVFLYADTEGVVRGYAENIYGDYYFEIDDFDTDVVYGAACEWFFSEEGNS